jgi:acetyl xylan esterase AXE1
MLTDLSESALRAYRSDFKEPDDFDEFWNETLAEHDDISLDVHIAPVETDLRTIAVFESHPTAALHSSAGHGSRPRLRANPAESPSPASPQTSTTACASAPNSAPRPGTRSPRPRGPPRR